MSFPESQELKSLKLALIATTIVAPFRLGKFSILSEMLILDVRQAFRRFDMLVCRPNDRTETQWLSADSLGLDIEDWQHRQGEMLRGKL